MRFQGTRGDDDFIGTDDVDHFHLKGGGIDMIDGRGGDDEVNVDQKIEVGDRFDGGDGEDMLTIYGELPSGFAFTGRNFVNFEGLSFLSPAQATIANGCDPVDHTLFIYALDQHDINASAVTGNLNVYLSGPGQFLSGSGDDTFSIGAAQQVIDGGAGDDNIESGVENDTFTGGVGADIFHFYLAHGSPTVGQDTITDFDVAEDKIATFSPYLRKYSQLKFDHDGQGGTIVQFGDGQSVDLLHVPPKTLSKSNFIIQQQVSSQANPADASHLDAQVHRHWFDPGAYLPTADMFGIHGAFGGLHVAHAAIA